MTIDVLPTLLMALPAAQGGFTLSFGCYADRLREFGVAIPDSLPVVLALAATTFLAALGTVIQNSASVKEVVRVLLLCTCLLEQGPRRIPSIRVSSLHQQYTAQSVWCDNCTYSGRTTCDESLA